MAAPPSDNRAYKRSWKNLLINKRYQLSFTLFMVGLAGLLMVGLGIWVMFEANRATSISLLSDLGVNCGKVDVLVEVPDQPAVDPTPTEPADKPAPTPMATEDDLKPAAGSAGSAGSAAAGSAAAGSASAGSAGSAAEPEHHNKVQIDESTMTLVPEVVPPPPPPRQVRTDIKKQILDKWICQLGVDSKIDTLESNRTDILWVLIATGLLLIVGLAVFGIKMTHKVAGPLFKVGLYFKKMGEGRLDKVWNLRKGDQLVEFYEHFKRAHAGVVAMERADIEHLKKVIATAEAAGLGTNEAVVEMRAVLARKEKAVE